MGSSAEMVTDPGRVSSIKEKIMTSERRWDAGSVMANVWWLWERWGLLNTISLCLSVEFVFILKTNDESFKEFNKGMM